MSTKLNVNTNIIAPTSMFAQYDSNQMRAFLGIITGHDCIPLEGSNGHSAVDPWEEAEVDFYDCDDGLGYSLAYNYEDAGYGMSKLLWHAISRNETYDGYFNVDRKALTEGLKELYNECYYDKRTLLAVANKFGIRID